MYLFFTWGADIKSFLTGVLAQPLTGQLVLYSLTLGWNQDEDPL